METEKEKQFFLWDKQMDLHALEVSKKEEIQIMQLSIQLQAERNQLIETFDGGNLREEVGKLLLFDSKYRLYLLTVYSLVNKMNPLRIEQINTNEAARYYQETIHLQTKSDHYSVLNSMSKKQGDQLLWEIFPRSLVYRREDENKIMDYYEQLSNQGMTIWKQLTKETFQKLWPEIVKIDTKCRMIHNLLKEEQEVYETADDLIVLSEHSYKEYYMEHLEEKFLSFEKNTLLNKLI
ncbi:MAG: DUF7006 family protein [Enterococcus sp.]